MNFEFKYKKYAEALYTALREDAFYLTMERSVRDRGSQKEAMLRYMEFSMVEAKKYGELHFAEDNEYGVSVWSKPLNNELNIKKSTEKKLFLCDHMGEPSLNTYTAIVEFMSHKAEPLIGTNYWYLSIVGVLPEFQRQGLGSILIKDVLKKTDIMKVPTYLETFSPGNMSFYARLGFQAIESFYEPTAKATYWLMIREPSTA